MKTIIRLSVVAIVVVVMINLPGLGQAPKSSRPAANPPLKLTDIEKLIHSPLLLDGDLADTIKNRGVSDPLTKDVVATLRTKGAGPKTLAALSTLIPRSILRLTTIPGAEVLLDGTRFQAGSDGQLTMPDLDPGTHALEVRKPDFQSYSSSIQLPPNGSTSLNAVLKSAFGFLSVSTNPPDAKLEINGVLVQAVNVNRMRLPVGERTVIASAPFRKNISDRVVIEPDVEKTITLMLPWDEVAVSTLSRQIHDSFRKGQYQLVLELANQYFQTGMRDKDVLADVAVSNFELDKPDDFKRTAQEALTAGATLRISIQHHHGGLSASIHPAVLQLTTRTLRFEPEGQCNFNTFETSLNEVRLGDRDHVILKSRTQALGQTVGAVNLIIPDPTNPKKEATVNLVRDIYATRRIDAIRDLLQSLSSGKPPGKR